MSVAYCSSVPVWLVAGVGRRLPDSVLVAMAERATGLDRIATGLCTVSITEGGCSEPADVVPSCAAAPELLR